MKKLSFASGVQLLNQVVSKGHAFQSKGKSVNFNWSGDNYRIYMLVVTKSLDGNDLPMTVTRKARYPGILGDR